MIMMTDNKGQTKSDNNSSHMTWLFMHYYFGSRKFVASEKRLFTHILTVKGVPYTTGR